MTTLSETLYRHVWRTSRNKQILICVLTMVLAPLMMVPLELQRRIMNQALPDRNVWLLVLLGCAYFALVCVQGAVKYWLNMVKGTAVEIIARELRLRIVDQSRPPVVDATPVGNELDSGSIVSMLAAETEDVSGFGGEALALPLLAGGTIFYVAAYLLWIEPAIAVLAVVIYFPQAVVVPLTQRTINRLARLRIRTVRRLGKLMSQTEVSRGRGHAGRSGGVLIDRIYQLKLWIYYRKFLLAALGNFLDSLGTIVVLMVGGYLVINGNTQVGTLVVFISGLNKIADPWDQLINYYRSVSNTAVAYDMIQTKLAERTHP